MPDPARFATLLADYCLKVSPGDQVLVASSALAAPALLALQQAILEREGWPHLRTTVPGQAEGFWSGARDVHLDSFPSLDLAEVEHTVASVRISAPANARDLAGIDPARLARGQRAREAVAEARRRHRWCVTVWPTDAQAQLAGMSLRDFDAFVTRAMFLDQEDPVAAWEQLRERQERVIAQVSGASEIRIEAEGTDLTLAVAGRTWINSAGERNMPSGEVFTGPLEDSAEGRIRFTVPTSPGGVEVEGVELEFRAGRVVSARAEKGEAYLREMLASDDGASRLGELGIGTNMGIDRAIGQILFDEKIGGTVHLAVGRSYPETGGINESSVHWDMICDLRQGGRLLADGVPVEID